MLLLGIMKCIACILESKKIKANNAPPHTCAKSRKDYKEPDMIILKDGTKAYSIEFYDEKARTDNSTLYRLTRQFINGYQVKRFAELWVHNEYEKGIETFGLKRCVWVDKKFYDKLVFL